MRRFKYFAGVLVLIAVVMTIGLSLADGSKKKGKEDKPKGEAKLVTEKNFGSEVLKSKKPVLVDFYADWCGPCRMLAPIIAEIAKEKAERLKVCKVDSDKSKELANKYNIRSIPTLILFKEGKEVARSIGYRDKKALLDWLAQQLK